jgi:Sulfotransferase family
MIPLQRRQSIKNRWALVLTAGTVILSIVLLVVRDTRILLTQALGDVTVDTPRILNQIPVITVTQAPKHGDVFDPGSLPLTRLETYHKCYLDPCKYRHHFAGVTVCNKSEKYNLTYYMIGKAASSTCRHTMTNSFDGTEARCDVSSVGLTKENDNMLHFTFFRDPYSRFVAGFHEALLLSFKPGRKSPIPKNYYQSFKAPFENMRMKDFVNLFGTRRGRRRLTKTLQNFIMDYDAYLPFDGHLRLQLPRLANLQTGRTLPLDAVFDTETLDEDFQKLAALVNAPPLETTRVHERPKEHKINTDPLTTEARRKICQLVGIEYCCLNYKMPEECNDVVKCRWTSIPEHPGELLIETLSPYPPSIESSDKRVCIEQGGLYDEWPPKWASIVNKTSQ